MVVCIRKRNKFAATAIPLMTVIFSYNNIAEIHPQQTVFIAKTLTRFQALKLSFIIQEAKMHFKVFFINKNKN